MTTHDEYIAAIISRTKTVEDEIVKQFGGKKLPDGYHLQYSEELFLCSWEIFKNRLKIDGNKWSIQDIPIEVLYDDMGYTISTVRNVLSRLSKL